MSLAHNVLQFVSKRSQTTGLVNPDAWFINMFSGGWPTASGKGITPESAKKVSAFYACVAILAETAGCLPLVTYKRRKDGGKERAEDLGLYSILHDEPNPEQTPFEFREMMVGHIALRGNFYARKEFSAGGQIVALWPLHPDRVKPFRTATGIVYEFTPESGPTQKLLKNQVHHIRSSTTDGLVGDSYLYYMAESLGMSLASEEFGARFFANDATPSGVLQTDKKLSEPAQRRLKADLDNRRGSGQAHQSMILEEGLKWQQVGITARDAQLLELRRFSVSDIARFFRIPLHMLQETDKTTSWGTGIESMSIGFVVYTLMPWLTRIEQACERDLLTPTERKRHYVKFVLKGLLRGDAQARGEFYTKMWQIGALSQNDIRELEDENPIDGGDKYYVPLNFRPHDEPVEAPATAQPANQMPEEPMMPEPPAAA